MTSQNLGSYTLGGLLYDSNGNYYRPTPTLDQLRARRLECLQFALAMYRREHACHVRDTINREEWCRARLYWTQQAYHAHGEIMTRLDSSQWY